MEISVFNDMYIGYTLRDPEDCEIRILIVLLIIPTKENKQVCNSLMMHSTFLASQETVAQLL